MIADKVLNGNILGIDVSVAMINKANVFKQGNLCFRLLDINDIDFENEFDITISNATLHWVKDHKRLANNCHRALKEGGVIRFNFAGDGNCSRFIKVIKDVMNDKAYNKYFVDFEWPWYMPRVDDYRKILAKSNFREIRIWDENADRYFEDADEMIRWIDQPSLVPFIKKVDDSDKERFRKAVIDEMVSISREEDGRCFETFRRINVYGKK